MCSIMTIEIWASLPRPEAGTQKIGSLAAGYPRTGYPITKRA